jgi:hypothetical protein
MGSPSLSESESKKDRGPSGPATGLAGNSITGAVEGAADFRLTAPSTVFSAIPLGLCIVGRLLSSDMKLGILHRLMRLFPHD